MAYSGNSMNTPPQSKWFRDAPAYSEVNKLQGRWQKHSLAIVYRHPNRPCRSNCSNQIGRSKIRLFCLCNVFFQPRLTVIYSYSRSYLKHCLTKSLFLQSAQSVLRRLPIYGTKRSITFRA